MRCSSECWPLASLEFPPRNRLALIVEPRGYFDFSKPELWISLLYIGSFAGPAGTWAAVSVARASQGRSAVTI